MLIIVGEHNQSFFKWGVRRRTKVKLLGGIRVCWESWSHGWSPGESSRHWCDGDRVRALAFLLRRPTDEAFGCLQLSLPERSCVPTIRTQLCTHYQNAPAARPRVGYLCPKEKMLSPAEKCSPLVKQLVAIRLALSADRHSIKQARCWDVAHSEADLSSKARIVVVRSTPLPHQRVNHAHIP